MNMIQYSGIITNIWLVGSIMVDDLIIKTMMILLAMFIFFIGYKTHKVTN